MQEVAIPTPDGDARAFTFHPEGKGPWPAVIFFMDAPAIRPALFEMCERLAVERLLRPAARHVLARRPLRADQHGRGVRRRGSRRAIFGKFMASTNPEQLDPRHRRLPRLAGQAAGGEGRQGRGHRLLHGRRPVAARGRRLSRTGSSPPPASMAAAWPPTRRTARICWRRRSRPRSMSAGADEDAGFPPEQADRLREALTAAGVDNEVEIYAGARTATPRPTCRSTTRRPPSGTGARCSSCSTRR